MPTLVLAGDHDIVRDEQTLDIYHHLAKGELCIFPGATRHSHDDPAAAPLLSSRMRARVRPEIAILTEAKAEYAKLQ